METGCTKCFGCNQGYLNCYQTCPNSPARARAEITIVPQKSKLTNREYLSTLDNQSFINWILYDAPDVGRMSTQSSVFLAEWLDKEYDGWINLQEYGEILTSRMMKGE